MPARVATMSSTVPPSTCEHRRSTEDKNYADDLRKRPDSPRQVAGRFHENVSHGTPPETAPLYY